MKEIEIIGQKFLQNCNDYLKVIEKTDKKSNDNHHYLYRCQFQKYPYEVFTTKIEILRGSVLNPQIEKVEFIDKIWPQNCGDSLKILEKIKVKNKNALYKCQFIKYPFDKLVTKAEILRGTVVNPQIEQVEFMNKIHPQNCGDSIKILDKVFSEKHNKFLFKCQFINYPYEVIRSKREILRGEILNKNLLYFDKNLFKKYLDKILLNFDEKQSIFEFIKDKLEEEKIFISSKYIRDLIIYKYNFLDIVNIYESEGEKLLRNFIEEICSFSIEKGNCSLLNGKEIDIYIPGLKLGFEYNGNYWHSVKKKKDRNYHLNKSILAKEKGIKLIHIWEDEWTDNSEEIKMWLIDYLNNKENLLFKKDFKIDLSKHPEFLENKNIEPEAILRGKYKVYNCGYYYTKL
ncbi:hypothetical protein DAC16_251 [Bacteroides phage DAC16]|nr:hypothetical protein DAC16_251 [Bacteroides phage DAC16]